MLYQRLAIWPVEYRDGIEAIVELGSPASSHPSVGYALDLAALERGYRVEGMTEARTGPRLHLNESDQLVAGDDEVDLAMSEAVIAGENSIACPLEKSSGESLSSSAEGVRSGAHVTRAKARDRDRSRGRWPGAARPGR